MLLAILVGIWVALAYPVGTLLGCASWFAYQGNDMKWFYRLFLIGMAFTVSALVGLVILVTLLA